MALASDAVARARRILQDYEADRVDDDTLLGYLNGARRALATAKPDIYAVEVSHSLAAGARQTLPTDCNAFLDIPSTGSGRAVTVAEREFLDAFEPGWRSRAGVADVEHFTFDERVPGQFEVYPPATAGATVQLRYSRIPADLARGASFVPREDLLLDSLADYVVARALLEDGESPANQNRGMFHLQLFAAAIGESVDALRQNSPNTANVGGRLPKVATGR